MPESPSCCASALALAPSASVALWYAFQPSVLRLRPVWIHSVQPQSLGLSSHLVDQPPRRMYFVRFLMLKLLARSVNCSPSRLCLPPRAGQLFSILWISNFAPVGAFNGL